MSLRFPNTLRKNVIFRISILYATTFVLSCLVLFVISYYFISSSIEQSDRKNHLVEFNELETQYGRGGIDALKQELDFEKVVTGEDSYFVKVSNPQRKTIFLNMPDEWSKFEFQRIEDIVVSRNKEWIFLPAKEDAMDLEILSGFLPDGYLLQVAKNPAKRIDFLKKYRSIFAVVLSLVIVLGFTGGAILANRVIQPIRSLRNTLNSILETDNIDTRAPVKKIGDEFDELTMLFNTMLDKIEYLLDGMRSSLDNVAHDIRTPVTRLRGTVEAALLSSKQYSDDHIENLQDCLDDSKRIITILNTLMDISEAECGAMKLNLEEFNLSDLIEQVVESYSFLADDKKIVIATKLPDEIYLTADSDKIRQALSNILDNAIKYTPNGGRVEIEVYEGQDGVIIKIMDSGVGIPPQAINKIWDRLYRGDESRSQKGLGLGLSMVKAIIQAHKGYIGVSSQPGTGSVFTVHIPEKA